jgi:hypothetical protein
MGPFKLDAVVGPNGRVELTVPLPAGTAVEVVVRDPDAAEDETEPEVEWDDHLRARLDTLDRAGADPRPWREVMDELRSRLQSRRNSS